MDVPDRRPAQPYSTSLHVEAERMHECCAPPQARSVTARVLYTRVHECMAFTAQENTEPEGMMRQRLLM